MDRLRLSRIDEELDSTEVAALCFLCLDVVSRKRLEGIKDAKELFLRLEEKNLLENELFLSQLLRTIRRADLINLLVTDNRQPMETDANPLLSDYRVMLYRIYEDMTRENLEKTKFLLSDVLGRRQMEMSNTALDVFTEMEKKGLMSNTDVTVLHDTVQQLDQQLALMVQRYQQDIPQLHHYSLPDEQRVNNAPVARDLPMSISDTQSSFEDYVSSDAQADPPSRHDDAEYYPMFHSPRGFCVIINNEKFPGTSLRDRGGTQQDAEALTTVFTRLGFDVKIHDNLTAADIRKEINKLCKRSYVNHDAIVICVLSHGLKGFVYGSDEEKVYLKQLTGPFTSDRVPSLAGKPKLFFIQACQGLGYQRGSVPYQGQPQLEEKGEPEIVADAGPVPEVTVPSEADFLLGMATVPDYKSFRHTTIGSIYIQELCRQLAKSAESPENDDILTILTRVNREVSKGVYLNHKQMPEPKYTLTKKVVLKYV